MLVEAKNHPTVAHIRASLPDDVETAHPEWTPMPRNPWRLVTASGVILGIRHDLNNPQRGQQAYTFDTPERARKKLKELVRIAGKTLPESVDTLSIEERQMVKDYFDFDKMPGGFSKEQDKHTDDARKVSDHPIILAASAKLRTIWGKLEREPSRKERFKMVRELMGPKLSRYMKSVPEEIEEAKSKQWTVGTFSGGRVPLAKDQQARFENRVKNYPDISDAARTWAMALVRHVIEKGTWTGYPQPKKFGVTRDEERALSYLIGDLIHELEAQKMNPIDFKRGTKPEFAEAVQEGTASSGSTDPVIAGVDPPKGLTFHAGRGKKVFDFTVTKDSEPAGSNVAFHVDNIGVGLDGKLSRKVVAMIAAKILGRVDWTKSIEDIVPHYQKMRADLINSFKAATTPAGLTKWPNVNALKSLPHTVPANLYSEYDQYFREDVTETKDYAALIKKADATSLDQALKKFPPVTTTVDWGTSMRGQGKRSGGMVKGAMGAPPRGKKQYTNILAGVPDYATVKDEVLSLDDVVQRGAYMRARAVGLSHGQAMIYAYYKSNDVDFDQAVKLMGLPVNEAVFVIKPVTGPNVTVQAKTALAAVTKIVGDGKHGIPTKKNIMGVWSKDGGNYIEVPGKEWGQPQVPKRLFQKPPPPPGQRGSSESLSEKFAYGQRDSGAATDLEVHLDQAREQWNEKKRVISTRSRKRKNLAVDTYGANFTTSYASFENVAVDAETQEQLNRLAGMDARAGMKNVGRKFIRSRKKIATGADV